MIKEAIILAGGLGTRLRSVVADRPKAMALINGKPFLYYLLEFLRMEGMERFVFSVGYLHEIIEEFIGKHLPAIEAVFVREEEPLGTGGAIFQAAGKCLDQNVLVCNGDTLYKVNVRSLSAFHSEKGGECTLALKPMRHFNRYGAVLLNPDQSVYQFKEKAFYPEGLINGGVYALDVSQILKRNFPERFSFEKDYLEKIAGPPDIKSSLFGQVQEGYFIDIGIPEDYERASREIGLQIR